jgi:hypothetical protein
MSRRRALLLAALGTVLAIGPAVAKEAAAWPQGLYGSVRMSEETGDLGGMELRFFAQGEQPMVESVICEGWCNESYIVPLERTATGFSFRFVERYEGGEGVVDTAMRVTLTAARGGFRAHLTADADPGTPSWEEDPLLRRLKRPFGLSVVHSQK